MDKLTINSALALQGTLKGRVAELIRLRDLVAVNETRQFYGEPKSEVKKEAQFDVKAVDKKVTELQNVLFKLDSSIKTANAITKIELPVDIDVLLAPLS